MTASTRRSFVSSVSSLLVLSAGVTVTATAAAIPAIASPASPGLSPRMAELIAEFVRLSAAVDAAQYDGDPDAVGIALDVRAPALHALVFERPESLTDYAAKMAALVEFMAEEDSELFTFRRLAEDATLLAGAAK